MSDLNQLMALMAKQQEQITMLLQDRRNDPRISRFMRHDAPATSHASMNFHGPGGLFSSPNLERPILGAVSKPRGLTSILPAYSSNVLNPLFGVITGIEENGEDEPTAVCDDAPTGYITAGSLTARFGRVMRATKTIESGATGWVHGRGEHTDLQMMGSLISPDAFGFAAPPATGIGNNSNLPNNVLLGEMAVVGTLFVRKLSQLNWVGDPTATPGTFNNLGYVEYPGLAVQVNTGQLDAESGNAVAAFDSNVVVPTAWAAIEDDPQGFVATMSRTYQQQKLLAEQQFDGAQFAWAMHPQTFYAITQVWPTAYYSQNFAQLDAGDASTSLNLSAMELLDMREQMLNGSFLPMLGEQVPVIQDTGIPRLYNADDAVNIDADEMYAEIYLLPLQLSSGFPTLYYEVRDWSQMITVPNNSFWTDGGRFLWTYQEQKTCWNLQARWEGRLVLRTPQLAARITRWKINNIMAMRSPYPADADYVAGGEVAQANPPTQSAVWL